MRSRSVLLVFAAAAVAAAALLAAQRVSFGQAVAPPERQWQRLAQFPHRLISIYFQDLGGPPRVGFAGCDSSIYRTTDGGDTWSEMQVSDKVFMVSDIVFKDSLTGWFSNWDDFGGAPYYKTTDGGLTWSGQSAPNHLCPAILYRPQMHMLLLSGWQSSQGNGRGCVSTDEGQTWQTTQIGNGLNGYAFLTDQVGVVTSYGDDVYQRTTDGGITWRDVLDGYKECWQPIADPFRNAIWAPCEFRAYKLMRSTDAGLTFTDFLPNFHSTGFMTESGCGVLYAQRDSSAVNRIDGVIQSVDGGISWQPIVDASGFNGPYARLDSRFFVQGSYIYASSNTSELWRYIGDSTRYDGLADARPLAESSTLAISAPECEPAQSTAYVRFVNDCDTAELVAASFKMISQGSPPKSFELLLSHSLPDTISGDYPLRIVHQPLRHVPDTAMLLLTYQTHAGTFADSMLVTGSIAGVRYTPRVATTERQLSRDTVEIDFTLLDSINAALGLDSIAITTAYDSSALVQTGGAVVASPLSTLREDQQPTSEVLVLRVPPNSDIARGTVLARIPYYVFLTPQSATTYFIQQIRLNDSLFDGCIATALEVPAQLPITANRCGDSTITAFLRGEQVIKIMRIADVADGETVTLSAARPCEAQITISNLLGQCVARATCKLAQGQQQMPLQKLGNGLYVLELATSTGAPVIARFAIEN